MASSRPVCVVVFASLTAAATAQELLPLEPLTLSSSVAGAPPQQQARSAPNFDLQLRFGAGNFEHEFDGSLRGDTDAGYFALQVEGFSDFGFGGGLRLEGIATDNDLFADAGLADTEAGSGELFLFFGFRLVDDGFRMPLRGGPCFLGYQAKDNVNNEEVDWFTVALRVEVEPELDLVVGESVCWSLFTNLGVGFGSTTIETDPATFEADADALLYNVELGTRVQLGPVLLGLGYLLRGTSIDDSDVVGGMFYRGVDTTFSGVQLTVGGRF